MLYREIEAIYNSKVMEARGFAFRNVEDKEGYKLMQTASLAVEAILASNLFKDWVRNDIFDFNTSIDVIMEPFNENIYVCRMLKHLFDGVDLTQWRKDDDLTVFISNHHKLNVSAPMPPITISSYLTRKFGQEFKKTDHFYHPVAAREEVATPAIAKAFSDKLQGVLSSKQRGMPERTLCAQTVDDLLRSFELSALINDPVFTSTTSLVQAMQSATNLPMLKAVFKAAFDGLNLDILRQSTRIEDGVSQDVRTRQLPPLPMQRVLLELFDAQEARQR